MLRTARRYDYKTDTIVFANNHPYSRDNYMMAGVGESADSLFNFCRHLCAMKVDNAEYALLTAIVIFSGKEQQPIVKHTSPEYRWRNVLVTLLN